MIPLNRAASHRYTPKMDSDIDSYLHVRQIPTRRPETSDLAANCDGFYEIIIRRTLNLNESEYWSTKIFNPT
jgi:hypothetical protein